MDGAFTWQWMWLIGFLGVFAIGFSCTYGYRTASSLFKNDTIILITFPFVVIGLSILAQIAVIAFVIAIEFCTLLWFGYMVKKYMISQLNPFGQKTEMYYEPIIKWLHEARDTTDLKLRILCVNHVHNDRRQVAIDDFLNDVFKEDIMKAISYSDIRKCSGIRTFTLDNFLRVITWSTNRGSFMSTLLLMVAYAFTKFIMISKPIRNLIVDEHALDSNRTVLVLLASIYCALLVVVGLVLCKCVSYWWLWNHIYKRPSFYGAICDADVVRFGVDKMKDMYMDMTLSVPYNRKKISDILSKHCLREISETILSFLPSKIALVSKTEVTGP